MTITNGYTDRVTAKAYLGSASAGTNYDTQIDMAVNAASRAIDQYCNRRFWLDGSTVARTFTPTSPYVLDCDDIGDSTVTVKTDAAGDGTFETTWAVSDFQLLPANAPYAVPEAHPYTSIRAIGSQTFPTIVSTWQSRLERVQIVTKWGWPAVPDAVVQACLIKMARIFHRKSSPQGIAAFDQFGAIRISRGQDSDVAELLEDYRKMPVLVA